MKTFFNFCPRKRGESNLYTAVEENNMHRKDRKAIDFTVLTQERRMLKPR